MCDVLAILVSDIRRCTLDQTKSNQISPSLVSLRCQVRYTLYRQGPQGLSTLVEYSCCTGVEKAKLTGLLRPVQMAQGRLSSALHSMTSGRDCPSCWLDHRTSHVGLYVTRGNCFRLGFYISGFQVSRKQIKDLGKDRRRMRRNTMWWWWWWWRRRK